MLYNISQAHEKLGNLQESVDYLKRFLEAEPDSDDRSTLLNKIANLEERIAKTGIKVTVDQPEAVIFVDDAEVGRSPVAGVIPLSPGAHNRDPHPRVRRARARVRRARRRAARRPPPRESQSSARGRKGNFCPQCPD